MSDHIYRAAKAPTSPDWTEHVLDATGLTMFVGNLMFTPP
ncbi:hypothetical protein SAMN06295879_0127 [Agreia bicolorata]|uniref:Uncharacterized protein n=1 Tax=Agreia bicolorata TaxID=110935 RepID=A0A1T4WSK6_9MICO|nr:hypothetical protein SAMN06295879_0127 [Agreia bicolorata]